MSNPFEDDDSQRAIRSRRNMFDDDVPKSSDPGPGAASKTSSIWDEIEDVQRNTLSLTENSLRYIDESEKVGGETAMNLLHQREQLNKVDKNLDHMDATLNASQKHINSIKSVFGGIKNYFSKDKSASSSSDPSSKTSASGERLKAVMEVANDESLKPNNKYDKGNMYNDSRPRMGHKVEAPKGANSSFANYEEQLSENLDYMGLGVSKLKMLADGLSQEIEEQNNVLDRINEKADRVNMKVDKQDKDLKKILRR